jgi:hypothetical protein
MEFQCYQMAGGRVRSGFGGSGHGVVGSPAVGDKTNTREKKPRRPPPSSLSHAPSVANSPLGRKISLLTIPSETNVCISITVVFYGYDSTIYVFLIPSKIDFTV